MACINSIVGFLLFQTLLFVCLIQNAITLKCIDKQYFSTKLQQCTNCTNCGPNSVVMRPCEYHHDTVCQPINEFMRNIDDGSSISGNGNGNAHHRHKHTFRNHVKHKENKLYQHHQYNASIEENLQRNNSVASKIMDPSVTSDVAFSNAEKIIWDWQAIALTSAVFACILFFLVMTLYSLHQAKQWRRLKENFEADVEELSARLSLMAAVSTPNTPTNEKGEFICEQQQQQQSSSDPANYLNNRCVYLEQLLSVRKDDKIGTKPNGNVYIEETNGKHIRQ